MWTKIIHVNSICSRNVGAKGTTFVACQYWTLLLLIIIIIFYIFQKWIDKMEYMSKSEK